MFPQKTPDGGVIRRSDRYHGRADACATYAIDHRDARGSVGAIQAETDDLGRRATQDREPRDLPAAVGENWKTP
jgi:hypothetical protein